MATKTQVRRRLAIGVAGALLASMLVGNVAPVAADGDGQDTQDVQSAQDNRDLNVGEATGLAAGEAQLTITSVVAPPAVIGDTVAAPLDTPYYDGRDDRM